MLGRIRIDQHVGHAPTQIGTNHLNLGWNRLGTNIPWVRNDWILVVESKII